MKKRGWIVPAIIIGIIILAVIIMRTGNSEDVPDDVAKCIGENSLIYVQLGCHACEKQEELFGDSYQYLNLIDCFYERDKCSDIQYTPTWIIEGEKYIGVQTIEKLRELTGC